MDSGSAQLPGGYSDKRATIPDIFRKWINRYVFSSEELQELEQFNDSVLYTTTIDLSVARTFANPFVINEKGRMVIGYGVTTSTLYTGGTPGKNTGLETVVNTVMASCYFNERLDDSGAFILKHGRGFRGDFRKLTLTNPSQSNNSMRIVVFKFNEYPIVCGDVPA